MSKFGSHRGVKWHYVPFCKVYHSSDLTKYYFIRDEDDADYTGDHFKTIKEMTAYIDELDLSSKENS